MHDEWDSKNVLMEVWWQFCVHKTYISKVHLCICYIFWYCFFFSFKSFEKVRMYAQKPIKREKLSEAIRRQHEWLERFIIRKSRKYCKYPRRLCSGESSSAAHSPITSRVSYVFLLIVHLLQLSNSSTRESGDFFDMR